MNRRHLLSLIPPTLLTACTSQQHPPASWTGIIMGIQVSIKFKHPLPPKKINTLKNLVEKEALRLEHTFSLWHQDSELSLLNHQKKIHPSPDLLACLKIARQLHQKSNGTFDPTIETYQTWLRHELTSGHRPTPKTLAQKRKLINFSQVQITNKKITLPPHTRITLNAIAQGYLTDRITELLKKENTKSALINFGEYRVLGPHPWPITIQAVNHTIPLRTALAVSSGGTQRLTATSPENHLIHPKTGKSPKPKNTYTVTAPTATLADGLATIAALTGTIPPTYPQATLKTW